MKFTLTYEGPLHSQNGESREERHRRSAEKWAIRREFEPQMRKLWEVSPQLQPLKQRKMFEMLPEGIGPYRPLIRRSAYLRCGIDVTFLRDEEPGELIRTGGDIDNRMKVLFDALAMPPENDGGHQDSDPRPFYCALESDSLIDECHVRTARLLAPGPKDPAYARVLVEITIKASLGTMENIALTGN